MNDAQHRLRFLGDKRKRNAKAQRERKDAEEWRKDARGTRRRREDEARTL